MATFNEGDRVARTLKLKNVDPKCTRGTVMRREDGHDNKGKPVRGYRVLMDIDKDGVLNHFTNKVEPGKGTWFTETELKGEAK